MKTPSENEELLAEVLADDEELRAATLQAGLAELRSKRRRRSATRVVLVALVPLAVAAALSVQQLHQRRRDLSLETQNHSTIVPSTARTIEGTTIRILTDEELLAFFKDRPVALIGSPGNQRLVLFDERGN